MNITIGLALLVVCATVYALIKRYETRLVLLTAGLVMTLIAMDPMAAFKQFDKSMTNGSLIIAICSALGFAGVISLTGCDRHLVRLLTKPLGKLGIFLLPACILVGFVVATAIPSMAGMSAAVGPTLIPLLVRAGFRPAMAAAAVASCVMAGYFNPGVSHNPFIAKLAGMEVMEFVGGYANVTFMVCGCLVVLMTGVCVAYGDFKKGGFEDAAQTEEEHQDEKVNVLCALAPLVPVALLLGFSFYIPSVKISVATAMLIGMMYAMLVTRADPQKTISKFFDGMGKGYGSILGIIIAAGVFASGLRATGVIDLFVNYLTHANEVAKIVRLRRPDGLRRRRRVRLQRSRHASRRRIRHEDRRSGLPRHDRRRPRPHVLSARGRPDPALGHRRRLPDRSRQAHGSRRHHHARHPVLPRLIPDVGTRLIHEAGRGAEKGSAVKHK